MELFNNPLIKYNKITEQQLKAEIGATYFKNFNTKRDIDNIDFIVSPNNIFNEQFLL